MDFMKSAIADLYKLRIGGASDTCMLTALVAAGLSTTPTLSAMVPVVVPAVLSGVAFAYFASRVLSGTASQHLLESSIDLTSDHSPIGEDQKTGGFIIGFSTDTGEPIYIDDAHFVRHFFIIGMTGVGKTVLGLLLMFQQIMRGGGLMFVDGKLDSTNIEQIWYYCQMAGRPHHFRVINPGDPANSHTYNPVLFGDPDEVSDRILSIIPSTENNPGADHYKQEAKQGVATLVSALQRADLRYNMIDLSVLLMNANALLELELRLAKHASTSEELKNYSIFLDKFRTLDPKTGNLTIDMNKLKNTFGGIGGRLYMFGTGKFGSVMNTYDPDINLYDAIRENLIIYVALPTMGKNESANNFGKLVVGDARTAISWIQALPPDERPNPAFLIFMDEQGSYATQALARPYEQSRSANVALAGAVQTFANLTSVSDEFAEMVLGNTWTKVYFKVLAPETATQAAEMIGMEMSIIKSLSDNQTATQSASFLRATPDSSNATGEGLSFGEREQEVYRVSPDDLRALSIGEAVVTYGGKHIFNVRVPRIEVTEEARRRFGPVMITRKRPNHAERRKGAQFFENAERYLHASRP